MDDARPKAIGIRVADTTSTKDVCVDPQLDLRRVPPPEQVSLTLEALDSLPPTGRLVLVTAQSPDELLRALEEHLPGRVLWQPLRAEDGNFQSELGRSPEDGSVAQFVGWDQRRIDDLLEDVDDLVSERRFDEAESRLEAFGAALERHMRLEEDILFPLYLRLVRTGQKTIGSMHDEHDVMRQHLRALSEHLAVRDISSFTRTFDALVELMQEHDRCEEEQIYPALDARLNSDERRALVDRLRAS